MPGELVLILGAFYALQLLLAALVLSLPAARPPAPQPPPRVSVVVAARNEEETLGTCLASLAAVRWPRELLEVLVVNDRSTDGTAEVIARAAAAHPFVKGVEAEEATGEVRGKANALAQGIDASTGALLLFTDADCTVPPGWVEETVRSYGDPATGLAAGFTSLRVRNAFEGMQALDWFFLFGLASAGMRIGFPITAVGTNLSVRRTAYEAAGGYRGIPFSVTEDYALVRAVVGAGEPPWRAGRRGRFPVAPGALVESDPCPDAGSLYRQKLRWFAGGRGMSARVMVPFLLDWLFLLLLPVALLAGPRDAALAALGVKLASEVILAAAVLRPFRKLRLLRHFPLFALYLHLYVLAFPLVVLVRRKIEWKQRVH